jgi:putative transcriptional regulator
MAKKRVKIFGELKEALEDVRDFRQGKRMDLRVTEIPSPPKPLKPEEIRRIRERLHASQAVFARFLCVSPKAVQSWEQGARRPQNTALRLLLIAKKNPQVLLQA